MKKRLHKLIWGIIGISPLLVNNRISAKFFLYLDRILIDELGFDGYLDCNGVTHYKFGIGSAAQLGIFLIMIITIIWIFINARFLFQQRSKKIIYILVCIGLALVMYFFWVLYYLDYYPLTGNLEIWY